ncbi:MgtC/SapB family protein [Cohnella algarum]|uniref:MgtC/SapB family protein n=1 Tax=Cohnella algarum TaxID=2044859 RepID=UPI001F07F22D|nr:MgtC/SapB family protein [Cohnella algarum]
MRLIETDIWELSYLDLTLRLFAALVLGGLVGIEREWKNHAAGFRTHILVCVGSAAIMLLSIYGFGEFANAYNVRMDPARLAAQVVSGVGFLGAGAIIRTGLSISGLTTAASLWVVAAIGLCAGAGFYYGAVLTTVLVIVSLYLLDKVENRMLGKRTNDQIKIKVVGVPGLIAKITDILEGRGLNIRSMAFETESGKNASETVHVLKIQFHKADPKRIREAFDTLLATEGFRRIETSDMPGNGATPGGKGTRLRSRHRVGQSFRSLSFPLNKPRRFYKLLKEENRTGKRVRIPI